VQLSASSRELLAQCGHLVLKPASPQSIELHSIPPARAGLQDIELAIVSQRVSGPAHVRSRPRNEEAA
jgi:hypothetical protein